MKIVGSKLPNGLYGIDAILDCPGLNINDNVNFVVDTGAANTIINDVDIILLGIDYDKLNPAENVIVGIEAREYKEGEQRILDAFDLPLSKIIFKDEESGKLISEELYNGLVLRHNEIIDRIKNSEMLRLQQIKHYIPSLLGIDILKNYKIRFTGLSVYLEI